MSRPYCLKQARVYSLLRLEGDEHAVADVVEDFAAVRLLARGDVDQTGARQPSAIGHRAEHAREIVQARRREREPVIRTIEAGSVGDRRHLDRRLGAVGERVVHFRIEVALGHLFLAPAEESPHRVGRRIAVARLEIHALAGGGQFEAA